MAYAALAQSPTLSENNPLKEDAPSGFAKLGSAAAKYSNNSDANFSNGATASDIIQNADDYCCVGCDQGTGHDTISATRSTVDNVVSLDGFRNQITLDEQATDVMHGLDGLTAEVTDTPVSSVASIASDGQGSAYSQTQGQKNTEYGESSPLSKLGNQAKSYLDDGSISFEATTAASVLANADEYCCVGCDEGTGHDSNYLKATSVVDVAEEQDYVTQESNDQEIRSTDRAAFDFSDFVESSANSVSQTEATASDVSYASTTSQSTTTANYETRQSNQKSVSHEQAAVSEPERQIDLDAVVVSLDAPDSTNSAPQQYRVDLTTDQGPSATYATAGEVKEPVATLDTVSASESNYSNNTTTTVDTTSSQYGVADAISNTEQPLETTQGVDLSTLVAAENSTASAQTSLVVETADAVLGQYATLDTNQDSVSATNYRAASADVISDAAEISYQANTAQTIESTEIASSTNIGQVVSFMLEDSADAQSAVLESGDAISLQYASTGESIQNTQNLSQVNYIFADDQTTGEQIESSYQSSGQVTTQTVDVISVDDLSTVIQEIDLGSTAATSVVVESQDTVMLQYATNDQEQSSSIQVYVGNENISTQNGPTADYAQSATQASVLKSSYMPDDSMQNKLPQMLEGMVAKTTGDYHANHSNPEMASGSYGKREHQIAGERENAYAALVLNDDSDDKRKRKKRAAQTNQKADTKLQKKKVTEKEIKKKKDTDRIQKEASRKKPQQNSGGKNDRRNRKTRQRTSNRISTARRKRSKK